MYNYYYYCTCTHAHVFLCSRRATQTVRSVRRREHARGDSLLSAAFDARSQAHRVAAARGKHVHQRFCRSRYFVAHIFVYARSKRYSSTSISCRFHLNDLVATNKNLEKWGVKNSALCESCSQEDQEDTLWHSLCECPSSVNIMTEITTLLNLQQFDAKSFIFGTNDKALNLLLLIAKHMIWRNRFFTRQFKISEYIAEAKLHITADANKMSDAKFVNKWENFIFIMEL